MTQAKKTYRDQHQKVHMADAIPLDTPFTVVIEPTNVCNFKCSFCFHSLPFNSLRSKGYENHALTYELFETIIAAIQSFPRKLKVLRFSGFGEPLLHKDLPRMIATANAHKVAERIMVISNGSCLTPTLSDALIDAGLNELLVSVEGISAEKYKELCAVDIDFESFLAQLAYFYRQKGDCRLFARVLNHDMTGDDLKYFHAVFGPVADNLFVDNIIPLFKGVDYSSTVRDLNADIDGNVRKKLDVCIQPFNSLFIHASGNVSACCTDYLENIIFGNVADTSLKDIWHGKALENFRIMQLQGRRKKHGQCRGCDYVDFVNQDENNIDGNAAEILKRIQRP